MSVGLAENASRLDSKRFFRRTVTGLAKLACFVYKSWLAPPGAPVLRTRETEIVLMPLSEARMTFGEHLEELRTRLIRSILCLIVTFIACFSMGETLVDFALGPHYKAITKTDRVRTVARMTKTAKNLTALSTDADAWRGFPELRGAGGDDDKLGWAHLFGRDILSKTLVAELAKPFIDRATSLRAEADAEPNVEKKEWLRKLAETLVTTGSSLAETLKKKFTPGGSIGSQISVLELMARIDGKIADADAEFGANDAEKVLGLGRDFAEVTTPLASFRNFLIAQRAAALADPPTDEALRVGVVTDPLEPYVRESLGRIDEDLGTLFNPKSKSLIATEYLETFMAHMKVALIFGLAFAFPFLLFEAWRFVGAGLYEHEQKYVLFFMPFSIGLFLVGVSFGYFAMIPLGLQFLASWGVDEVDMSIKVGSYIGLFFTLTLLLGLVFQLPLVMVFLTKINVATVAWFRSVRRYAIFALVVGSAIITPPDVITLLLTSGPLVVLYEIGILVSALLSRGDNDATDEPEVDAKE